MKIFADSLDISSEILPTILLAVDFNCSSLSSKFGTDKLNALFTFAASNE